MIALRTSSFDALYEARSEHLLVFFGRRWADHRTAVGVWAETWAQAFVARRRFRGDTEPEAVSWLYALGCRQLAACEHRGSPRRDALARLGLESPELGRADADRFELLIADPARFGEFDREVTAPAARPSLGVVHEFGAELLGAAEPRRLRFALVAGG